jgi:hypothetical protein
MAKVPGFQNCTIDPAKITGYLLVPRLVNDKSKFLFSFGFSQQNWQILEAALRDHIRRHDYIDKTPILDWTQTLPSTVVGFNYVVRGSLRTPDRRYPVIQIVWAVLAGNPPKFNTILPQP